MVNSRTDEEMKEILNSNNKCPYTLYYMDEIHDCQIGWRIKLGEEQAFEVTTNTVMGYDVPNLKIFNVAPCYGWNIPEETNPCRFRGE